MRKFAVFSVFCVGNDFILLWYKIAFSGQFLRILKSNKKDRQRLGGLLWVLLIVGGKCLFEFCKKITLCAVAVYADTLKSIFADAVKIAVKSATLGKLC